MRSLVFVLALFSTASLARTAWAIDGVPDCEDGIDNDNDGLVDFPADPQCKAPDWPTEYPSVVTDAGAVIPLTDGGRRDGMVDAFGDGGSIPPGEGVHDGSDPFEHPDGGTTGSTGGSGTTAPNVAVNPPRSGGCAVGEGETPTLPILLVLAVGCGLALLSRRSPT